MWFYGKHFNGSYIPHVTALFHLVFGKNPSHLHLVNSLHFLGFLVFLFFIVRKVSSDIPALLSVALASIPTSDIYLYTNNTYFAPTMFWGSFSVLLLMRILDKDKPAWRQFFWYGFVIGLGFWAHIQIIFFLGTGLILLFLRRKSLYFPQSAATLPGMFLGSVVTVIDSYFHNFVIFTHFFSQATKPIGLLRRFSNGAKEFLDHVIRFLGYWTGSNRPFFWAVAIIFAGILVTVLVQNRRKILDGLLLSGTEP
jgi:hypothetical protein